MGPGTRLGPYEITEAIGAGGMGEVYRGRDATLNRDVAIKVLPAAMAADPERLTRFKREAQVLASLNHPNIASIFGMEVGAPLVGALDGALVGALDGAPWGRPSRDPGRPGKGGHKARPYRTNPCSRDGVCRR